MWCYPVIGMLWEIDVVSSLSCNGESKTSPFFAQNIFQAFIEVLEAQSRVSGDHFTIET
jgi:hypothetical protein